MTRDTTVGSSAAAREIHEMCQRTVEMLRLTASGFRKGDVAPFAMAQKLGREIHYQEKALTEAIARVGPGPTGGPDGELFFVPMHLERISDNIESLIGEITTMLQEEVPFTDRAMREIGSLFEKAIELAECVRDAVATENRVLVRYLIDHGRQYAELANDYGLAHQQRLVDGLCIARASSLYLAMLDYLKGIEAHSRQIAQQLGAGRSGR